MTKTPPGRVGMAALVGRPNVGKSTLLNRLMGHKISIVSQRPQTTRNRILGIKTETPDQLIFIDTPGIHRGGATLNRLIVQQALESLPGVDCIVVISEVDKPPPSRARRGRMDSTIALHPDDTFVLDQLTRKCERAPLVLAINKIDRLSQRQRSLLLPLMAAWQEQGLSCIVPISALTGEGITTLENEIRSQFPRGPYLFPVEMLTDQAESFFISELIREQVFLHCRQEIPYATAVEVIRQVERPRQQDMVIEAFIHLERESQKAILIGHGGRTIKLLGTAARQQISRLLGCPVHLKLTVHVDPNWSRTPAARSRIGLS